MLGSTLFMPMFWPLFWSIDCRLRLRGVRALRQEIFDDSGLVGSQQAYETSPVRIQPLLCERRDRSADPFCPFKLSAFQCFQAQIPAQTDIVVHMPENASARARRQAQTVLGPFRKAPNQQNRQAA